MGTIVVNNDEEFRSVAYGNAHLRDERFLRNANERARRFESSLVGNARTMYESLPTRASFTFDVETVMDEASEALALNSVDLSRVSGFVRCGKLATIQRPPKEMQAYILAEPTLWKEWQAGRLQGYDLKPSGRQVDHRDNPFYQQVMVGRLVEQSNGEYVRTAQRYDVSAGTGPNVRTLTQTERTCVLDVWQTAMAFHNAGHDVTNPAGGRR